MIVMRRKLCYTLYKTAWKACVNRVNVAVNASPNLWHKRLGHMSEKGLQLLAKKKFIPLEKGTLCNPYDYYLFDK